VVRGAVLDAAAEAPRGTADGVWSQPSGAAYAALGSGVRGLAAAEAAGRLAAAGRNVLPAPRRTPLVVRFLAQFTDLFAVLLVAAAGITYLAAVLSSPVDTGSLQLGTAILGVVLLNAVIGFVQEYSAERTVQALQAMVPALCRVLRDGQRVEVAAADVVPGDVVVLEAGDAVPADCRIVDAHGLAVDNAALTGESLPARRQVAPAPAGTPVLEARDAAFMGTTVVAGTGRGVVYATGTGTQFGRIFQLTAVAPVARTPLQRQVALMARRVSAAAVAIGALLFVVRGMTGHPLVGSFVFALGVMVALVPEGLPATMSVSLAVGVRRMARRHALVKRLPAVEALGSTTVICTDKTGTLTQAEMTVQRCWVAGRWYTVSGVGYAPDGMVSAEDGGAQDGGAGEAVREVLRTASLCSNARLVPPAADRPGWRVLGDPTEGALLVAAAKAGVDVAAEEARTPRLSELPFDSERKLMTTVHRTGDGCRAYVKGAPQELLARCTHARWDGELRPLDDGLRAGIRAANDAMARRSLRVLAVAERPVAGDHPAEGEAEQGLTFLGLVGMVDPPRPEVAAAVSACRQAGIRMIMVTGDHALTAEAIGRRVGIVTGPAPVVVRGDELTAMDDDRLRELLRGRAELLFSRVSPEHKMRIVATLSELGEVVAVTGDGANDAPALKRADIGVAMGAGGTDVAREAAAMVLLDDSFASIVTAVELGRSVYRNIRKFLIYLFSHNIAELAPILVAAAVGFPLVPLTAVQVLAIDLGSDVLPALALGTEPPEPDVMDSPPRSRTEQLFSAGLVRRFLFLGLIQSVGVVAVFFWRIHEAGLPFSAFTVDNPYYRQALTLTQAAIVVSQFFNGFAVRTDRQSILRVGLLSNPRLIAAECLGVGLMAAISYLPPLQAVFHTAPLRPTDWLVLAGFGLVLLVAEETRKWAYRRRLERRA
jgi:Ca2+-transporting ATPase